MKHKRQESGFITMIVIMVLLVAAVVYFAYQRVANTQV